MTWEGLTTFCSKCGAPVIGAFELRVQPCGCGTPEDLKACAKVGDFEDRRAYQEYKERLSKQEYLDFVRNRRSNNEESSEEKE